jgi:hypothetical protein
MTRNPAEAPGANAQFVGRFRWTRDSATPPRCPHCGGVLPPPDPEPPTKTKEEIYDELVHAYYNQ